MNGAAVSRRGDIYDLAYLLLCALACAALTVGGDAGDAVQGIALAAITLPLYALTRRFTDAAQRPAAPRRAAVAAVFVGLLLAATTAEIAAGGRGPLLGAWSTAHWGVASAVQRALRVLDLETVDAALTYAIFPSIVVAALGWRWRDIGFGPSRTGFGRALALWCGLPIAVYAVALALGHGTLGALVHRTVIDVFRNGFAEEILFRGIVLRLTASAFGLSAGNVVQALLFGCWHLGADLRDVRGNPALALLDGIATQSLFGYVMGLLTLRTGNVVVPGFVHALADAAQALR
jgi:membrane protease YdiL (CAAX protease family)